MFTAEAPENAVSCLSMNFTAIYSLPLSARDCKLVNVKINLDLRFSELGPCRLLSSGPWILVTVKTEVVKTIMK